VPRSSSVPGRRRLAVAYHSAAGGTRLVAELLAELLSADHDATAVDIYSPGAQEAVADSDLAILCYPTYFLRPSLSMQEFIGRLEPVERPVYLVTTYELYTENSLRACTRLVQAKGMTVVGTAAVRAPGTDVTVVVPDWLVPWLYRFERGLGRKLQRIADDIRAAAQPGRRERVPGPKWYTPLAQVLQRGLLDGFFEWRDRVRIIPERCTACGACMSACDRDAWAKVGDRVCHDPERCELCTRCIHRCPRNAIVLVDAIKDNKRLDARLYARLKAEARAALQRQR
jgi:NAD-dependent dihydropyrimidine dehydrogenase PreA subunit